MKYLLVFFVSISVLMISGCQNGDGSGHSGGRSGDAKAYLTVSITDAAIEEIDQVWVRFTAIELKPAEGSSELITFDTPLDVNLLDLQGSLSKDFFSNKLITAGEYNWIRLHVNSDKDGIQDSYVVLKDGSMPELEIPSGAQSGLKINSSFTVDALSSVSLTIDFDLRRSIVISSGDYHLKPTLRLVDNATSGHILGQISSDLTVADNCSDTLPDTGNAVYVFAGADAIFDDIDGNDPDPVTSSLITLDPLTGDYQYEIGFLPEGNYTLAYTCMADLDDPENDDSGISFTSLGNYVVSAPVDTGGAELNR